MKSNQVAFCAFLLCVVTVAGFHIDVKPYPSFLGLTLPVTLEVKCSVPLRSIPAMDRLLYLMLCCADQLNSPEFLFLASVHVTDSVLCRVPGNGTASGVISTKEESYIQVGWTLPADRLPGAYRCFAVGVNKHGHPMTVGTSETGRSEILETELSRTLSTARGSLKNPADFRPKQKSPGIN